MSFCGAGVVLPVPRTLASLMNLSFDGVPAARKATRESGRLISIRSCGGCGATPAPMADVVEDSAGSESEEEDELEKESRKLTNDSYARTYVAGDVPEGD